MSQPPYINIDVSAISALAHRCSGCSRTDVNCCSTHEVCVGTREMNTIIGVLPLAAKHCPCLKVAHDFDNVFDEVERGLFAIDTHEDGLCVFAYHADSGIRCSLHTVAVQMGISPHLLKPHACTLWPLVLREPPGAALSICSDALRFPCNRTSQGKRGTISPTIQDSIAKMLGSRASGQILKAAKTLRKTVRVRLRGQLGGEPDHSLTMDE